MARVSTGEPSDYDDHEEAAIEAAAEAAWLDYGGDDLDEPDPSDLLDYDDAYADGDAGGAEPAAPEPPAGRIGGPGDPVVRKEPDKLRVTATIEWAGAQNPKPRRTTTLVGLNLKALAPYLAAASATRRAVKRASPYRSYRAVGWHAQLRELTGTKSGQAAAARAGLAPTPRTLLNWLSQATTPKPENLAKIHRAYDNMRDRRILDAKDQAKHANHELAQKLNRIVSDAYQAEVRFFGQIKFKIL